MKKKTISVLIITTLIILSLVFFKFNILGSKNLIFKAYRSLPQEAQLVYKIIFGEADITGARNKSFLQNFYNDYNVKFLPETQFIKINFIKKDLKFISEQENNYSKKNKFFTFYLEIIDDKIWIIDASGKFYELEVSDNQIKVGQQKIINSNLLPKKILDTVVHDDKIYVSFFISKDNCNYLKVFFAKINSDDLNFQNFFDSNECGRNTMRGGKMQFFKHKGKNGLLLSTADIRGDKPTDRPQNENSIFGKILFIDFIKKEHIIFSKGFRNVSGLFAENNIILATENGPRGGDEINKIAFNKNYGWPISSYGEKYSREKITESSYLKNHTSAGFEEPIFSFVPSVGISEIIKLPNTFSNLWINNFLISSLWGKHLYRVQFDESFHKLIFFEKIFVGQRIRELKYFNKMDAIILALEENGELGILTTK